MPRFCNNVFSSLSELGPNEIFHEPFLVDLDSDETDNIVMNHMSYPYLFLNCSIAVKYGECGNSSAVLIVTNILVQANDSCNPELLMQYVGDKLKLSVNSSRLIMDE